MNKSTILTLAAALLAAPAAAAPALHDRIVDLCGVSNTDLEGQRMAKACRTQVRARFAAEQRAKAALRATTASQPLRTADATPVQPR